MSVGRFMLGAMAYLALWVLLLTSMTLVARGAARLLRVPRFGWFRQAEVGVPEWRLLATRAAALVAPWSVSFVLLWMALLVEGAPVTSSTRVQVLEGAAKLAGMKDGDKVVAIAGQPIKSFDELRAVLQGTTHSTTIVLERAGRQVELQVTPRAGRIGIAQLDEYERLGLWDATRRAVPLPGRALHEWLKSFARIFSDEEKPELAGPVRIVQETQRAQAAGIAPFVRFLGLLAVTLGIFALGLPILDALSAAICRQRYREMFLSPRVYALERARAALLLVVLAAMACVGMLAAAAAGQTWAVLPALFAMVSVSGLYPLLWFGGRQVWSHVRAALVVGVSVLVPCVVLLAGFDLWLTLRRQIAAEGYRAGWLGIAPKTVL